MPNDNRVPCLTIFVENGIVQSVLADDPEFEVCVVDLDTPSSGQNGDPAGALTYNVKPRKPLHPLINRPSGGKEIKMLIDKIRIDPAAVRAGEYDDTVLDWVEKETILFDLGDPEKQAEYLMDLLASKDTLGGACNWRNFVLRHAREYYIEQCVAKVD